MVEWFYDVVGGSHLQRLLKLLLGSGAGDENGRIGQLSDLFQNFNTADIGQAQIKDNAIRLFCFYISMPVCPIVAFMMVTSGL